MQKLDMFSIYDSKASAFLQPFFSKNSDTAIREFTAAVNQSNGNFQEFTEDFSIFTLGTFDQDEGKFTIHKTPIHLANAISLKQQEEVQRFPTKAEIKEMQFGKLPGTSKTKETTPNV